MQIYPWLVIHGIPEHLVIHGAAQDMVYCAVGLGVLFIRWKMTALRIAIAWSVATLASMSTVDN